MDKVPHMDISSMNIANMNDYMQMFSHCLNMARQLTQQHSSYESLKHMLHQSTGNESEHNNVETDQDDDSNSDVDETVECEPDLSALHKRKEVHIDCVKEEPVDSECIDVTHKSEVFVQPNADVGPTLAVKVKQEPVDEDEPTDVDKQYQWNHVVTVKLEPEESEAENIEVVVDLNGYGLESNAEESVRVTQTNVKERYVKALGSLYLDQKDREKMVNGHELQRPGVDAKPIKESSRKKQYICGICNKQFRKSSVLLAHERLHTGEKPFSCSYCSMRFAQKTTKTRHEILHTGEKRFSCSLCQKQFIRKAALTEHERLHSGEKPFICSFCYKCFSQKSTLISHERLHRGEKPFKCSFCEKCFTQRSALTTHERSHRGEKFTCGICHKQYAQRSSLTTHERSHTGEKPFKCNICDRGFAKNSYLVAHETLHMDEKPFTCRFCDKQFTRKTNLIAHERQHAEMTDFVDVV